MLQNFISKLSDKEKKILYVTLAFVLLALFDRLFLGPVTGKIKQVKQEIIQQKINIANDMKFISRKHQILAEGKTYEPYFETEAEEKDVIINDFLSTIERISNESNVNIVKSNPSDTKVGKLYVEYFANLDCSGEIKNILTFLHKINSDEDLLKVVRLNMTPKRGSAEEVNLSMSVVKLIIGPGANGQAPVSSQ